MLLSGAVRPGRAFFFRDILAYWVPQVESLVRAVDQRSWPLWNPYFGFGAPMLADASYQLFYPTTWLNLLLLPATYYKLLALSHMALAGVGTYRLARRYELPAWPAFGAAALWLASGPYASTVSLYHHFTSASWMPWLLLRLEDLLEAPGARNAARLGLVAALQLLGGSGDLCLMTAIAAALRIAAQLWSARPFVAAARSTLAWAGLAAALGFAVAAAQWWPTLALVAGSGRSAMTAEAKTYWSLSPLSALDLLFPRLIGEAPLNAASRDWLYEGREPFLTHLYLGAATLPLAALGAVSVGRSRRWLVLAALLFFCLALGRYNPWYAALARLPPFGLVRFPVKYVVPFCFCWCLLAGRGLQHWQEARAGRAASLAAGGTSLLLLAAAGAACLLPLPLQALIDPRPELRLGFEAAALTAFSTTLAAAAAVLVLWGLRTRSPAAAGWSATLVGIVALLDVGRVSVHANPGAPEALLTHVPPLASRLRAWRDEARVLSLGATPGQLARGPQNWEPEARWSLGLLESLRAPAAARFRIFGSYDGDFTGLTPATVTTLSGIAVSRLQEPVGLRLLQLGAVDALVSLERAPQAGLRELPPPLPSVFRDPLRVFEVPDRLPRYYAVSRARVRDEPASYLALADPGFDATREIVLAPGAAGAAGDAAFSGQARLLERRMDRLSLEAELSSPGYVVMVEAYDPSWRAWVDGSPAELLRANVAFRAVAVPAGRHRVELAYRPRAALWGLLVSAGAIVVSIVLASRRS